MTTPFPMIEKAVKELVQRYEPATDHVGGDLSYAGEPLYVYIALVPGGSTDQIEGEWILDVDCFAPSYGAAMNHALALEALLVGPRHITGVMRIDNCYQNEGPVERPWDDDNQFRVGATYVFTARRQG